MPSTLRLNTNVACFLLIIQGAAYSSTTAFVAIDETMSFSAAGYSQNVNLMNTLGNTYLASPQWQHDESVMLGLGLRTYQHHDVNINTSARFLPRLNSQVHGDVLQLRSPLRDNLAYAYNITSQLLFVDNIITWTKHRLQPGFLFGLGRASNRAANYHEVALTSDAAPGLDLFSKNTRAQFALELGAVLDYSLKDVTLECAYRYIDAGQGQLGLSPAQNTMDHLSTGPIRYHTISLGVRFERIL